MSGGRTINDVSLAELFIEFGFGSGDMLDQIVEVVSHKLMTMGRKGTTREELIRFHGVLFYIMSYPMEGPRKQYWGDARLDAKEDMYLQLSSDDEDGYEGDDSEDDDDIVEKMTWKSNTGVITPVHHLSRFMTYSRFRLLCTTFTLPTYGRADDPFDAIRKFSDSWNTNMQSIFTPGSTVTADESMALWRGMHMPGLMVVPRKPTPVGREAHTLCCNETGIMIAWEPYEGAERMDRAAYIKYKVKWPQGPAKELGKGPATVMRLVEPYFGSARWVSLIPA